MKAGINQRHEATIRSDGVTAHKRGSKHWGGRMEREGGRGEFCCTTLH